jgi:hypothetical protein
VRRGITERFNTVQKPFVSVYVHKDAERGHAVASDPLNGQVVARP